MSNSQSPGVPKQIVPVGKVGKTRCCSELNWLETRGMVVGSSKGVVLNTVEIWQTPRFVPLKKLASFRVRNRKGPGEAIPFLHNQ